MSRSNTLKKFENNVKGQFGVAYDYIDSIGSTGDFKRVKGINALINSLRNLLLTPLGSYPFNQQYGSLLYKKVWEPLDNDAIEEIEYEVKDRVIEFDPRITIENVDVGTLSDNKGVVVNVKISSGEETGVVKLNFSDLPDFGLE
jgi:phage baseplate assembly protein W